MDVELTNRVLTWWREQGERRRSSLIMDVTLHVVFSGPFSPVTIYRGDEGHPNHLCGQLVGIMSCRLKTRHIYAYILGVLCYQF